MRVIHLLAPARVGGLERVVHTLSNGLAKEGVAVVVAEIVGGSPCAPLTRSKGEPGGLELVSIPVAERAYIAERRAIRSLLRHVKPDILHTHGYRPDVLDSPVARALGIPTVTTVHGFTGGGFRNRLYEWLQKRAFRRFDAVVAVSRSIAEAVLEAGVNSEKIHLVRNAWHPDAELMSRDLARRELGLRHEEKVLGWVGRLTQEKGPEVMLRAMERLRASDVRLCMIGSGAMEAGLRRLAERLGIQDRIKWVGEITDAYRFFSALDVMVLSSWTEGTPMVLLEAMAAEVPIVTTAVGGIPDMLSPAEAVLVPPGSPESLAEAIRNVVSEPEMARSRASNARARLIQEFALDPWVDKYCGIYAALANGS